MLECCGLHHASCPDTEARYMRLRGHGQHLTAGNISRAHINLETANYERNDWIWDLSGQD